MQNKKGKLFVISGPSGVGKGTLLSEILAKNSDLKLSISYTTRKPRPNERHGVNYFYVTKDEFNDLIKNDKLLEWAEFAGNCYGTGIDIINKELLKGTNVVLEIDVQGALQVKEKIEDAILIFILPPSFEELKSRLVGRETETQEAIAARLAFVEKELNQIDKFHYNVVNDKIDEARIQLQEIIDKEKI
ncbi:MAG: guanylate kinase [Candidatus Gastranaerophilales bacterium]|nr:guanylate kinase [Candidatus Gastranaerophilales bacterium]